MVAVTIGEVIVDWIGTKRGATFIDATDFFRAQGGNAANVAATLSRLGTDSRLIGKVGDDLHGKFLLDRLAAHGVDLRGMIVDKNHETAQCYCLFDERDEWEYHNWPRMHAAHLLAPEEISADVFEDAHVLHATGISLIIEPRRSAVFKALDLARERGCFVSFDGGFPTAAKESARKSAFKAMTLADSIKVNLPELMYWTHAHQDVYTLVAERHIEEWMPKILELGVGLAETCKVNIVMVTVGAKGSLTIFRADKKQPYEHVYCPPFDSHDYYVSTLGAGDAYIGGALHSIASMPGTGPSAERVRRFTADNWLEVTRVASAVATLSLRSIGATEKLPSQAELDRFLLEARTCKVSS